jgi:hypothetical protein
LGKDRVVRLTEFVSLALVIILAGCTDPLMPNRNFDREDLNEETVVLRRVFYRDHTAPVPVEVSSMVVDRIDIVARGKPKNPSRVAMVHADTSFTCMRDLRLAAGDTVRISTRFLYVGDMYVNRRDIPGWGSGTTRRGPIHDLRALERAGL